MLTDMHNAGLICLGLATTTWSPWKYSCIVRC